MENASLAVRMAGGVLIALLIIGFFISMMVVINENQQKAQDEEDLRQVALFNESYSSFENRIITGYQMLSLINKAIDYNRRMTDENANSGSYYVPIHIYARIVSETDFPISRRVRKNGEYYYDMNMFHEAYESRYPNPKAREEAKDEFKNLYFIWEETKHIEPNSRDARGNRLGNVDGVGRVYEMFFYEHDN